MSDIKTGLIGLGAMGRNHARVLQQVDDIDLVGVHDPTIDGSFNGVVAHDSAETLLGSGIDACIIAAPTAEHEALASIAAEHNVSAFIEKPIAHDHAAATRLTTLFEKRGLIGAVGHIERYNPAVVALKQRLSEGILGGLYQIVTRRQGPFPGRIKDVGVIMDLASHDIDLTQWATDSRYKSITAWTAHKSGREFEDLVIVGGRLDSGLLVSHHVNWLSATKERATIVTGEGGTLVADTLNADLYFYENAALESDWQALGVFRGVGEGNMTKFALARKEPLVAEIEAFRDAINGEPSRIVSFAEGAEVVRVAEAIKESATCDRPIELAQRS